MGQTMVKRQHTELWKVILKDRGKGVYCILRIAIATDWASSHMGVGCVSKGHSADEQVVADAVPGIAV